MIKFIENITDVNDNKYLTITFHKMEISKFLEEFKAFVGDIKFNIMSSNQQNRDSRKSHTHHMTVLNVMDYKKSINNIGKKEFINKIVKMIIEPIIDIEMIGIGSVTDNVKNNQTFFIVCKSTKIDNIRVSLGLKAIDLHITIGFDKKDVFGKSKGIDSLINSDK